MINLFYVCHQQMIDVQSSYPYLYEFVKEGTKHFDESHDLVHALSVCSRALEIAKHTLQPVDFENSKDVITYAAMLHDVCDHKYTELSITPEALKMFCIEHLGADDCERVLAIIDNVSYSKEVKGKLKDLGSDNVFRDIVSDADKLEAIGVVGVTRCYKFAEMKCPGKSHEFYCESVVRHSYDKLLWLSSKYIRTEYGKELAQPLHGDLVEVVLSYLTYLVPTDPVCIGIVEHFGKK
jgi:HD superfamily phosphodiesterase